MPAEAIVGDGIACGEGSYRTDRTPDTEVRRYGG